MRQHVLHTLDELSSPPGRQGITLFKFMPILPSQGGAILDKHL